MYEAEASPAAPPDELDGLLAAISRLRQRSAHDPRSHDQLGHDLLRLRHHLNLLELVFAVDAARFARDFDDEEALTGYAWIRHDCHMSGRAVSDALQVGRQLDQLPASLAAMEAGRIGFGHLALLAATAGFLAESPSAAAFDEGPLLRRALSQTVTRFRRECIHARHAADARRVLEEHVLTVEDRSLRLTVSEEGNVFLRGFLDPVGGSALRLALDPLSRSDGPQDWRSLERRQADALVELAGHGLDCAAGPGGRRPHLQVTTTLETLQALPGAPAGELDLAGAICATTVQRLACDASVTRVLLGPDSMVLDVGRARRVPATATRTAVRLRDRGCVWPGCDRPPTWTEVHHLQHWASHGSTQLDNLVLLCHRHHWSAHEGGWRILRAGDGRILTLPPQPLDFPYPRGPDPSPN